MKEMKQSRAYEIMSCKKSVSHGTEKVFKITHLPCNLTKKKHDMGVHIVLKVVTM